MDQVFERKVKQIPTLFTHNHAHIIYGLIRWLRPQSALEVGSFHGFITAVMAKAIEDNFNDGVMYAIDDFSLGTSAAILHNNLLNLGLAHVVAIIDGDSQKVEWPPCDFAFIDGDHSYTGVLADVEKAISMGVNCFVLHDTQSWWGVNDFIKKAIEGGYVWSHQFDLIHVGFDEGLAVFLRKPAQQSPKYTQVLY